ncbi:hypothetical protein NE686_17630 [Tissierella carlieri]|uniref:Uncharacterized protein n=1 Tax=Tissierella carlieri TaxID=689904 RepID=A0ABT1SEK9_9FIRM|nr:hypothetical protein [Tissierella carlieri]MCQ4924927.1 hypothetical protein [Tissierella carlieri]
MTRREFIAIYDFIKQFNEEYRTEIGERAEQLLSVINRSGLHDGFQYIEVADIIESIPLENGIDLILEKMINNSEYKTTDKELGLKEEFIRSVKIIGGEDYYINEFDNYIEQINIALEKMSHKTFIDRMYIIMNTIDYFRED